MKLLLFDIDGTLLNANGTGRRGIEQGLSDTFGKPITTAGISFGGRTDLAIMREILQTNDLPPLDRTIQQALDAYESTVLSDVASDDVELLPGVPDLLVTLADHSEVQLALLTGNIRSMAFWKLEAVGLDHHFPFGAFGCDHAKRHELPGKAVKRAKDHTGRSYIGSDVVIIGDTPNDIRCGRGIGAFSVAVCTGHSTRDDLASHQPHVLLNSLEDTDAFIKQVMHT